MLNSNQELRQAKHPVDIHVRAFEFGVRVIHLCEHLDKTPGVRWHMSKQLLRSGTSIGANVEEAQAAQSTADFVSKLNIALKEARETHYWLRLLIASKLIDEQLVADLTKEADEIQKILGAIIVSTKERKNLH